MATTGFSIFPDMVQVINRAPIALTVRFDGEEKKLVPGEDNWLPRVTVPYAKAQNPIMGSEEFDNPAGYRFLVSVKHTPGGKNKDPQEMLTEDEWNDHLRAPQRLNREEVADLRGDPKSREVIRGKKLPNAALARFPMGTDGSGMASITPE